MQWVRPGADCFLFVLQPQLKLFVLPIIIFFKEMSLCSSCLCCPVCARWKNRNSCSQCCSGRQWMICVQEILCELCYSVLPSLFFVVLFCFYMFFVLFCFYMFSYEQTSSQCCREDPLRVVLSYSVFAFSALNRPLHSVDVSKVQVVTGVLEVY